MNYELRWVYRGDLWIEEYNNYSTAKLKQEELKKQGIISKIFSL